MRHYWQPVALPDEFDARLGAEMAHRPVKAVRVLGQDLVLFRDVSGQWGLLDCDCPHRGADRLWPPRAGWPALPFLRWKFATDGRCPQTPAEGFRSKLCQRVRQRSHPAAGASPVWSLGAAG
ncbi:MAG: Rieske 2Fe-2S domain-containing protein [Ideonella sp.]|nr:Rieske 2Fe-2S domain-containing protein [Ideonella sp.]